MDSFPGYPAHGVMIILALKALGELGTSHFLTHKLVNDFVMALVDLLLLHIALLPNMQWRRERKSYYLTRNLHEFYKEHA